MSEAAPLSALLAVEHAAVYAYGEAGGIVAAARPAGARAVPLVLDGFDAHRRRRDRLADEILVRGGTPPAALPAYRLSVPPADAVSALRMLADVEDRCAASAYDALGQLDEPPSRDLAARMLADAAVRALRARLSAGDPPGVASVAFPGA